jgi:hypothetical protein
MNSIKFSFSGNCFQNYFPLYYLEQQENALCPGIQITLISFIRYFNIENKHIFISFLLTASLHTFLVRRSRSGLLLKLISKLRRNDRDALS